MIDKLAQLEERYDQLSDLLADPAVANDNDKRRQYGKEQSDLEQIVTKFREYRENQKALEETQALLVDKEMITFIFEVSFPDMTSGAANLPVTTHDPAGIGEDANKGFGTVVAPAGACPVFSTPNPVVLASKAQ